MSSSVCVGSMLISVSIAVKIGSGEEIISERSRNAEGRLSNANKSWNTEGRQEDNTTRRMR